MAFLGGKTVQKLYTFHLMTDLGPRDEFQKANGKLQMANLRAHRSCPAEVGVKIGATKLTVESIRSM